MSDTSRLRLHETIRVLHVDDDRDALAFAKIFLEMDGRIKVDQTDNPEKALALAASGAYDCLVTDYHMPSMDGIRLSQEVRRALDIPIIIYTGEGSEKVAEEAFKTGINDYLRKEPSPSNYKVLAKRIETVVESQRAHTKLVESERRLRRTLDHMMEGCQIIDHEYRYLYLNDTAVKHARKSREELLGKTMMECYPCIEDTKMFRRLETCMNDRTSLSMENLFKYPDGSETWYMFSMEPVPEGVFILSIDIDARKKAECELRLKEETLRNTFRASPNALIVSDLQGMIRDCNDAAARMLGFNDMEELIGRPYLEFIYPSDRVKAMPDQTETVVKGLFRDKQLKIQDIKGNSFPTLVSVSVVHDNEEKPINFVAAVQDVTEQFKNIERLRNLHLNALELSRARSLKEIYHVAQSTMENTFGFYRPDILFVEAGYLIQVERSKRLPGNFRIPLKGKGLTVKAVREKHHVLVNDVRECEDYLYIVKEEKGEPLPDFELSLSELCVPIIVGDEAIGVLNVECPTANYFTENDVLMLNILASHVAEAIKRVTR